MPVPLTLTQLVLNAAACHCRPTLTLKLQKIGYVYIKSQMARSRGIGRLRTCATIQSRDMINILRDDAIRRDVNRPPIVSTFRAIVVGR